MERKLLQFSRTTSQSANRYALVFLNKTTKNQTFAAIGHSGLFLKESRLKGMCMFGGLNFIFKEKETKN